MLKSIFLGAFLFAACVVWAPTIVRADAISAPFVTVGVGDTFTIPISITAATDLSAWQFDLVFDPTIVQANSLTEGAFMSSFGTTFFGPGVIDNTTGLISLVTDGYVDLPPYPSGDGVLANIEFTAISLGVSPLTFSNVFLNFYDTGFDIANGQITVTDASGGGGGGGGIPVPEPATLVLLASGMGLLVMRRLAGGRDRNEI